MVVNYKTPLFGFPLFTSSQNVKLNVDAGQIYYIKFSIETVMRFTDLKQIPSSVAENEIRSTQLLIN